MKYRNALIVPLTLLAFGGCGDKREATSVVPNKATHAAGPDKGTTTPDPLMAKANEAYYTTKQGDTLSSIAKANKMTLEALIQRNHLKETTPIKPGMQLIVTKPAAK